VDDAVSGQGPIAGILAGLKAASHEVCAVIACDMPDIHLGLMRRLVRKAETFEAVVPVLPSGLVEPLFAVYRRSVRAKIQKFLTSDQRSLLPLLDAVRTCRLPIHDAAWLRNLNTPDAYQSFLKSLKAD
jgi:molybdopterin-guanine dinucleotide biosynthesis protein A